MENIEHYVMHCSQEPASEIKVWQSNNNGILTLQELLEQGEIQEIIYKHATTRNFF